MLHAIYMHYRRGAIDQGDQKGSIDKSRLAQPPRTLFVILRLVYWYPSDGVRDKSCFRFVFVQSDPVRPSRTLIDRSALAKPILPYNHRSCIQLNSGLSQLARYSCRRKSDHKNRQQKRNLLACPLAHRQIDKNISEVGSHRLSCGK